MELAISILKNELKEREGWLEYNIGNSGQLSLSLIKTNIDGLKKAIDILTAEYRVALVFSNEKKKIFAMIKRFVCKKMKLRHSAIDSNSRERYITEARQIMFRIYYDLFIKDYTSPNKCYVDIGNYFNKDRNNIRSGVRITRDVKKINERSLIMIKEIENMYKFNP